MEISERDYGDLAGALQAAVQIVKGRHGRDERAPADDPDVCPSYCTVTELLVCAQCGLEAVLLPCEHGGRSIRPIDGDVYCERCRLA